MTLVETRSVKEVADFVQARVVGDKAVRLIGISSVESAGQGNLVERFAMGIRLPSSRRKDRSFALVVYVTVLWSCDQFVVRNYRDLTVRV